MKFQELVKDIDLSKTKLVRHNLSNDIVAHNYSHGYLDIYQSIQTLRRFRGSEYVLSFLGIERTESKFQGCYRITGTHPLEPSHLPSDFMAEEDMSAERHVFWVMEKTSILSELIDRLVIYQHRKALCRLCKR